MPSLRDIDTFLAAARAFVLSGGAARRAGGINKSLIRIPDGSGAARPIIEHQIEALRPIFSDRITVITDRPADFASLNLQTLPDFDVALAEDRFPLRGFARALSAAADPLRSGGWAFLLAADMPWPDVDLIRAQAERILDALASCSEAALTDDATALAPAPSGLVVLHGGRHQPFHAFYNAGLAASARAALSREDRSLRAWIASEPAILTVPGAELLSDAAALDRAFTGFNTPPVP